MGLHIYIHDTSKCPLIYLGNTLNVVVVFQFHDDVLHNRSHCSHIDDRLHSISTVSSTTDLTELIRSKNEQDRESYCQEELCRKLQQAVEYARPWRKV